MSVKLTAVFDDIDTAEFALISIKRNGIPVSKVNIARIDESHSDSDLIFAYPITGGPSNAADNSISDSSGVLSAFPGVLPISVPNYTMNRDTRSNEARLSFETDEASGRFAETIIVSCHGHRITKNSKQ